MPNSGIVTTIYSTTINMIKLDMNGTPLINITNNAMKINNANIIISLFFCISILYHKTMNNATLIYDKNLSYYIKRSD